MEKKMILVGMRKNATTQLFFNHVLEQLIRYEIDITDVDRERLRFETPHTKVWFVDDYYAKYFLDGILADAIFGEQYPELLDRARDDTIISSRDHIGLVDYINEVERVATKSLYPRQLYISMGRRNGRTAFLKALERFYAINGIPTMNILKGENNMTQEEKEYVRRDIDGAAILAATMREVQDRNRDRLDDKFWEEFMKRTPKLGPINISWSTNKLPGIKNVIFSGPCTIVMWEDGTKTIVRCEKDALDPEKGLAMAIAKKALGTNKSGSNYYDIFKKWLPKEETEEVTE